jgi:lipoate-protein ligase A
MGFYVCDDPGGRTPHVPMAPPAPSEKSSRLPLLVDGSSCAESVRADDLLLRRGQPVVRVTILEDRSVSYGVNVPEDAPYLLRARAAGISTVRRSTGGTGVLHDRGDLAFTIVLPRDDPRVGRDFVRAYARLGAGIARWYGTHGIEARWGAPAGVLDDYCLLGPRGQILRARGRVVSGAAQHLTGRALLHHGAVPARVDRELIGRLFEAPSRAPFEALGGFVELGLDGPRSDLARELGEAIVSALDRPSPG